MAEALAGYIGLRLKPKVSAAMCPSMHEGPGPAASPGLKARYYPGSVWEETCIWASMTHPGKVPPFTLVKKVKGGGKGAPIPSGIG